ncbi:hypothetical protein HA402_015056 [Bradysia odoriphaga]|nr:hypothetical protein HA402_015056 [Bradysia odoriphaga]
MKFIVILAVLCFCVQGSLQQCFSQNFGQGFGSNYCQGSPCMQGGCGNMQGGGGCGRSTNPEILITLYKIMFHLTTTTTTATPTTRTTTTTGAP